MEFTADRKRLQEALQIVGGVAMLRTLKDVLQNVYIEARDGTLTLKATDYEVGIQVKIPEVDIRTEGVVLLPSAQTVGIFREVIDSQVTMKADGTRCEIRAGRSRFRVVQYDPEHFPGLPGFPSETTVQVKGEEFIRMIRHVSFASAEERTRYAFDGIKLLMSGDRMRMVSTDGKRLSHYWIALEKPVETEVDALLPARAMSHFIKALGAGSGSCELGMEGNRFGVRSEHVEVYAQQIEGSFPNFAPLLDKELARRVTLDVEELLSALRKAALFAGSDARVVRMKLEAGNLNVSSNVADFGDAETDLAVEYDGDAVELGFNPDYIMDFLKVAGSGSIELEFENDQAASRWTPGEQFVYLVMPVSR